MSDRMVHPEDELKAAREALAASARAAGWPRVEVGAFVVEGPLGWQRALEQAHDVVLAALEGALAYRTSNQREGDNR